MTPHFQVESWDQVKKLLWDTLFVAAVFRVILMQFRVKLFFFFSLTFHVRVFSGNLKLAAQNFSDEEVLKVRSKFRHSLHTVLTLLSSKSSYVLENCLFKFP